MDADDFVKTHRIIADRIGCGNAPELVELHVEYLASIGKNVGTTKH
jgi:hypothetical protein